MTRKEIVWRQPTEPAGGGFKDKIHLKAYPTMEMGGMIWAYMGPRQQFRGRRNSSGPKFRRAIGTCRKCGRNATGCRRSKESSPAPLRFSTARLQPTPRRPGLKGYWEKSQTPKLEVNLTDYGYLYAAIRPLNQEEIYVRTYQYVMPFHQFFPSRSDMPAPLRSSKSLW